MAVRRFTLAALLALGLFGCGAPEPTTTGAPAGMRRLTEEQYRNSIADIFGPDVKVSGRFEPILRPQHGLIAAGTSQISVSPAGFEQYYTMATTVAAQVVDEAHRVALFGCAPGPDAEKCLTAFFQRIGLLVLRRPLTGEEAAAYTSAAKAAAETTGDFYAGAALSLGTMLASPQFIFEVDRTERAPDGSSRLDAYAKASRLGFFLTNSTPDQELLDAAARGELHDAKGLAKQVDRLMASPRLETSVRAFFSDMFGLAATAELVKDPVIYPSFVRAVKEDMPEQTLRTITRHVLVDDGDYRDLFTTRRTVMTRPLGVIYGVPIAQRTGWVDYEFPDDGQRAGLLTMMNFLALNSHDGRSSPTLRGKALRELVLCQPVPIPPGDVDFSLVQNTENQELKTARDRVTAHRANPTCAGCHKIMDPIGLGMESFDGIGTFRDVENGNPIDVSGDLDGVPFKNAVELGKAVHGNPATPACLVSRMYEFAGRRAALSGERAWLDNLNRSFASDGYRVRALMRRIAVSEAFYRIDAETKSVEGPR